MLATSAMQMSEMVRETTYEIDHASVRRVKWHSSRSVSTSYVTLCFQRGVTDAKALLQRDRAEASTEYLFPQGLRGKFLTIHGMVAAQIASTGVITRITYSAHCLTSKKIPSVINYCSIINLTLIKLFHRTKYPAEKSSNNFPEQLNACVLVTAVLFLATNCYSDDISTKKIQRSGKYPQKKSELAQERPSGFHKALKNIKFEKVIRVGADRNSPSVQLVTYVIKCLTIITKLSTFSSNEEEKKPFYGGSS
ncbi:hypothetical protein WA026_002374 [Henosepilachna vigintioctopunctata]|uniref:Uncharacterized protein n=1 Tax=Henosepilachna vigintioctopunctata TaxID=420089 RepID=A0AAW1TZJ2_9CUCU